MEELTKQELNNQHEQRIEELEEKKLIIEQEAETKIVCLEMEIKKMQLQIRKVKKELKDDLKGVDVDEQINYFEEVKSNYSKAFKETDEAKKAPI
jgi:hypothetical protein